MGDAQVSEPRSDLAGSPAWPRPAVLAPVEEAYAGGMKSLLFVCVVLAACDGSDDDGGGGGATITLGGASSGTVPALAVASKVSGEAFYTVGVSIVAPRDQFTSASASFRIGGTPAAGTFTSVALQVGALEVSTNDGKSWAAFATPVVGNIGTLTLSSVSELSSQGGTTLYTVHGSLSTSTLKPAPSQGGADLTMSASF